MPLSKLGEDFDSSEYMQCEYAWLLLGTFHSLLWLHSVQLSQSGSALICVILHTQGIQTPDQQHMYIVALEGLSACISVLRHLGERVSWHSPTLEMTYSCSP